MRWTTNDSSHRDCNAQYTHERCLMAYTTGHTTYRRRPTLLSAPELLSSLTIARPPAEPQLTNYFRLSLVLTTI